MATSNRNGEGASPRGAYAKAEDWATHRDLITRLYWDEDRTLREVRELMKVIHGFNATEKMYKWRFKSWGLHKNLNRKDVPKIVYNAFGGNQVVLPVIRGRQVGPKKLKDYLCKITVNWDGAASLPIKQQSSPEALLSAIPQSLGSPEPERLEDRALMDVILYTQRRMQSQGFGICAVSRYDWDGEFRLEFWSELQQAVASLASENHGDDRRVNEPRDHADNFRLLDRAFGHYSRALDGAWPAPTWTSIHAVLLLGRAGAPLAESFVRYARSLCSIKLGPRHAVTRLWTMIESLTLGQFWHVAIAMLNALLSALVTGIPREDELLRTSVLYTARSLEHVGAMPFAAAAEAFQSIIDEFRSFDATWDQHEWCPWVRWWHAEAMFEMNRLDIAKTGLVALGPMIHDGYDDFDFDHISARAPVTMYYELRGKLHEALGETELATAYYVGAFTSAKVRVAWNAKDRLMRTSSELREHYLRIGDVESANRTEREAQAHLEAFAGGVSTAKETEIVSVDEI
ncbi:hypothetical protein PFICI_08819 [Pestalotiopsis fici W106-1]|uniref:Clr5 domain-containing protein n=1 Tax=Pestalotiopsis fici (strain W106-1 / CGMCC3.15140) TaxID=1229662 RepID=W3X1C2_PESFW|nr:uncharacterized protein PFICI_08819 [Pestalotiopsis fici W106-1]ETS78966.1 hypothetical protein PFICI_08819 [Pestalotiopsis fici W106-1]